MRPSGRAADQLRNVSLEPDFAKYAEGSCLVQFGDTHVICTASLDDQVAVAPPVTVISPAWAETAARDPHNADTPIFVNLFIVNSFVIIFI